MGTTIVRIATIENTTPQMDMNVMNILRCLFDLLFISSSVSLLPDLSHLSVDQLEALKKSILASRDGYFDCLHISTFIVAIGCFLEIAEIYHDTKSAVKDLRGQDGSAKELNPWGKLAASVGWLLIVVGLIGEFRAEAIVNTLDGNMGVVTDQILQITGTTAHDAVLSAMGASDVAGTAKTVAGEAKDKADAVGKRAAAIDGDLSKAKQFQVELMRHVEEAANDRMVNGVGSDIRGDHDRRVKACGKVKQFPGTRVAIQSLPDTEPKRLADSIAYVLGSCGWNPAFIDESTSHIPNGWIFSGVVLVTSEQSWFTHDPKHPINPLPPSQPGNAAIAATELLEIDLGPPHGPQFFGVHWEPEYDDEQTRIWTRRGFVFPPNSVLILVGSKPPDTWYPSDLIPKVKAQPQKTSSRQTPSTPHQ